MTHFAGGVLIGLAALLLYATLGRIAGVSGIAYGVLPATGPERHWRLLFLGGLVAGGWLATLAFDALPAPPSVTAASLALALGAGVLVGVGTRMGNGCTSGHGVCGLGRRSPRSLAAVVVFMALGMATATLLRPALT
ncbi:MAG: YeeE/YedE family protein [Nevskiaceae bacterium]